MTLKNLLMHRSTTAREDGDDGGRHGKRHLHVWGLMERPAVRARTWLDPRIGALPGVLLPPLAHDHADEPCGDPWAPPGPGPAGPAPGSRPVESLDPILAHFRDYPPGSIIQVDHDMGDIWVVRPGPQGGLTEERWAVEPMDEVARQMDRTVQQLEGVALHRWVLSLFEGPQQQTRPVQMTSLQELCPIPMQQQQQQPSWPQPGAQPAAASDHAQWLGGLAEMAADSADRTGLPVKERVVRRVMGMVAPHLGGLEDREGAFLLGILRCTRQGCDRDAEAMALALLAGV